MREEDHNQINDYLKETIKNELWGFTKELKKYYNDYKINPKRVFFEGFYNEEFYCILKYREYCIYFNDIEETFGICKIKNNICKYYAEFYDMLLPTIIKFRELIDKNTIEEIFKT